MLNIKNYNLHSFTIGSKHVRSFSFDNCSGIIIDFVLGECGANKSPLPLDFYQNIRFGEGLIQLESSNKLSTFTASRDNISINQKTGSLEESLNGYRAIVKQGIHIIPGTLSFMNSPKAKFLGMVWQFTESKTQARERFNHPVADDICKKLIKIKLKDDEYPSQASVNFSFRTKIKENFIKRGCDDYLNFNINIGCVSINELWPDSEENVPRTQIRDNTRIGFLSIDAQVFFDPRRVIDEKTIESFANLCRAQKGRIVELLKGVGFDTK